VRRSVRELQPAIFESLVADLSACFARVSAAEIDGTLTRSLRRIVQALNLDRAGILQTDPLSHRFYVSHQWARPGVSKLPAQADFRQVLPTYARMLLAGSEIVYSSPAEMPRELAVDAMKASAYLPKSHAGFPMRVDGTVVGAIGFAAVKRNRTWSPHLLRRLHTVTEIVANAIERKRAAIERLRLRDEIARVSQAAALGELAASIAHELNQPIAAILSNAEAVQSLVGDGTPDLAEVRTAIGEIIQDDTRAAETIRRLRSLFGRGPLERAPVDLSKVLKQTGEIVLHEAMVRDVSLLVKVARTLPRLLADRVQLQQAILNLVLNAFDAVSKIQSGPRRVMMTVRRRSNFIVIQVSDSGPGIDSEVLPRIFHPFFSTKPTGLGVGLAISRSVVEAHGGRLTATSGTSGGATFTIELPVSSDGDVDISRAVGAE
jgi:signal transduction histidine kinase